MILEDTRQQPTKHENIRTYFAAQGIRCERCKLYVGDYTFANDSSIAVDTKQSVIELAMDLNAQHDRFRRECIRAQEAGINLIILTEETLPEGGLKNWKPPGNIPVQFSPKVLRRKMIAMQARYGVRFYFCDSSETGARIIHYLTEARRNE